MAQTAEQIFGAGASINGSVMTIDFAAEGRDNGNLDDPSAITPAQAATLILKHQASLSEANNDPTAAIGASTTPSEPTYVNSRGGSTVSQMRRSYTIYGFYNSADPTNDPDNLVG